MPSIRRRRKRKNHPEKGELFQIVQEGHVLAEKTLPSEGAAVSLAQDLARVTSLNGPRTGNIDYIVRLKPVFGPPDDLYLVRLTPEGETLTAPAAAVDRGR